MLSGILGTSVPASLLLPSHCSNNEPTVPGPAKWLLGEKVTWLLGEALSRLSSCSPCWSLEAGVYSCAQCGVAVTQPDPGPGRASTKKDKEGLGL